LPQIDASWFQVDLWLVILGIIVIAAFIVLAINRGILAHRRTVSAGKEDLIGKTALVKVTLDPEGIVLFKGERWTAISESGRVEPGEEVTINKVDSLKLYVAKKQ
jgi:membrane-bound ClpP family serine protease